MHRPDRLSPLLVVRVSGPSMVPTLRDGDLVLVRRSAPVRPGDVVIAQFPALRGLEVIKRAVRPIEGGWWVASDNPFAGGDSSVHGVAVTTGRAVLRWRRGSGWPVRRLPGPGHPLPG